TKAFKRLKTDEPEREFRVIQKIVKCELRKLQTKAWDKWYEKLSSVNSSRLWSETRKLKGSMKPATIRNTLLPLRIQQKLRDRHEERSITF
ncbi:hypothetical protein LSH36_277g02044, partial [Paralvinella palmiformis]